MSSPYLALRQHHTGPIVLPGDPEWDEARRAWNLANDQRPAAVARCASVADVQAVLATANAHDLRIAVQGTGHNAAAAGPLTDTILLRTGELRAVTIDPAARRARAEAGVVWSEVVAAAAPHGLAALAGSAPSVGVVGYSLGGGVSWLARRYGLAANHVTAMDVVTADGQARRIDHDHDAELFWALRGGGGGFAVVTAIEFDLVPVPEVHAGMLVWPWERAEEVLERWRQATAQLPDGVTSVAVLAQIPPLPDIPEPFRGRSLVIVEAVAIDGEASLAPLLEPLRACDPELDTFATMPSSALGQLHMDPEEPVPATGGHVVLADVTPDTLRELLRLAGPGSDSPLLSVELRHLDGALAARPDGAGALGAIDGRFLLFGVGLAFDPDHAAAIDARVAALADALGPWRSEASLMNFSEHPTHASTFFAPEVHDRLVAVKRQYDPDDRLVAAHTHDDPAATPVG